uniref:Pecanex-like protein n=1 Tax=Taenia asiatica TaxID=60517 RepID=A0A0R3VZU7_TAEAS
LLLGWLGSRDPRQLRDNRTLDRRMKPSSLLLLYCVVGIRSPDFGEVWTVFYGDCVLKCCDTLLCHGGERCPQEMLFCLLNEGEATGDTESLVAGLFEEAVWLILMQMGNLVRQTAPSFWSPIPPSSHP